MQGNRIPLQGEEHIAPLCYVDTDTGTLNFKVRWHGKNLWQSITIQEFLALLRDTQGVQGLALVEGIVYNGGD
jgi:hypothetical protein